ncbi:hypothetical protein LTR53_013778 [Teratosphaeriaceae sp. CCFEE 6253]|nr:hypothetical protein LTR53_013778 [Teratosphaeriaceae sp. CCFEE 6253]
MVPHVRDGMSWLSPKRRRTTGNLKTIATNGQTNDEGAPVATTPGASSPRARAASGAVQEPTTPTRRPLSQPVLGSGVLSSPGLENDGNLFYAYARRGDDLRYLLTFASASTANDWFSLLQTNFPDTSRPGQQLFSFTNPPDLLQKAWKHPAFAHLKSKWMYISFSDTTPDGLGGAAQGIIPVQDAQGNLVAGSGGLAPGSPELGKDMKEFRREMKGTRHGVNKMEEHFERMMEAVERNTAQIASLAERQQEQKAAPENEERNGYFDEDRMTTYLGRINDLLAQHSESMESLAKKQAETDEKLRCALEDVASKQRNDYLDMSQLSSHLDRVQTLLERSVSEQRDSARELLEQQQARPVEQIDLAPLTSHLDRVREAVEQQQPPPAQQLDLSPLSSRLDKLNETMSGAPAPSQVDFAPLTTRLEKLHETMTERAQPQIDLSPLTAHLSKVQEAVEQNSSLIKALLDEGTTADAKPSTPFWGRSDSTSQPNQEQQAQQAAVDLSPLNEHLQKIHEAIAAQSAHMQALVGFASGGADDAGAGASPTSPFMQRSGPGDTAEKSLAPFGEHLEQIYNAIEEGNAFAKGVGRVDLEPLVQKLEATRVATEGLAKKIDTAPLVEKMEATRAAVESSKQGEIDLQPLKEHLDGLAEHLKGINASAERSHGQMSELLSAHGELQKAVVANGQAPAPTLDLDPLIEKLEEMRASVETTVSVDIVPLAEKFDDLVDNLQGIGGAAKKGNEQLDELLRAHDQLHEVMAENKAAPADLDALLAKLEEVCVAVENGGKVDLEPLIEKFEGLEGHLGVMSASAEQQSKALDMLLQAQEDIAPSGPKLDVLAEHLKGIRSSSANHNDHLQLLLRAQERTSDAMLERGDVQTDFGPLTEKLNDLAGHLKGIGTSSEKHNESLQQLLQAQDGVKSAMADAGKQMDFAPLADKFDGLNGPLVALREWAEYDSEHLKDLVESQRAAASAAAARKEIDLAPLISKSDVLSEQLGAIRDATKEHTASLQSLLEAQKSASTPSMPEIDLTPLTDRLHRIHESLQRQSERGDKTPGTGDAKFIMSALSSHLSKIQAVTEANAQHVKALRDKQNATQQKMQVSVASTSDAITALVQNVGVQRDRTEERAEALGGQVRELMGGQREMVDVMREVAMSITAQNKQACDHVVVPPPRKVGRKIVGFVYDAKDGPIRAQASAKTESEGSGRSL